MFLNLQNTRYMQYVCAMSENHTWIKFIIIAASLTLMSTPTYLATFSAVAEAMHAYWTSPALITLQSEDSPLGRRITDEEGSWIVSLHKLTLIPAAMLGGWLIDRIGRKYTLLLGGFFILLPWFFIIFGKSIIYLYIARSIAGVGAGIQVVSITMYIGEIAESDIRGKLGTSLIVFKLLGSLLVLCVGPYISYVNLAIMSIVVAILFVVLYAFMPESPYYLMKKNREVKAEKNLRKLSRRTADDKTIANRLAEIENRIREDMQNKTTIWEFISNADHRRGFIIMLGVKTLHQFSGTSAIDGYMQTIIASSNSNISEEVSSIIFGFVQLPAVLLASILVDKLGRKPLWIASCIGCAVALFAEGTFFYFQDQLNADVSSVAWMPTVGLSLFLLMNPLGIVPLPYVLLGEIFATNIKGIAGAAVTVYSGSLAFLVSKFFKPIANAAGMHTVFYTFASVCLIGVAFIVFVVPETKGKSLSEIQLILKKEKVKQAQTKDNTKVSL